jgi:hypothetical protein
MREWHVKHMEQTLVKFITGLSEDASRWQMKLNKKYGTIGIVSKRIEYDIKHGVTNGQVISFLQLIRTESSFSEVRIHEGSMERLDEMQAYFGESSENSQNHDRWYSYLNQAH